ncbi:MAG: pyridoxal-phosphate dependent enzyme [Cytophagales bacterium]|nr:pyridoxal-phosphate dependent enzyme [Bernardetiaceae bacterium]MDW8209576.1 pyridoxal-phosphate dependent enzyme [Cytophagales bacterium]
MKEDFPTRATIEQALVRLRPHVQLTPVLTSGSLNKIADAELFFKCENFQRTGSFKMRGAVNAVFSLSDEAAAKGVATHSSGNHGQAVAKAAQLRHIPAYVVMPENAPRIKVRGVEAAGGTVIFCQPTLQARQETLDKIVQKTGAEFIPPYNDYRTIAGQATCAYELLEQVEGLDFIIAPCGGGGLLSGTALAAHYFSPSTAVLGAEPKNADDAHQSFYAGYIIPSNNPSTIADGLRTSLGDKTFAIIRNYVQDILTTSEENIVLAMRFIWERLKIVIEPSCAVPLAALLENRPEYLQGKRIGIILTGGNVDLDDFFARYYQEFVLDN